MYRAEDPKYSAGRSYTEKEIRTGGSVHGQLHSKVAKKMGESLVQSEKLTHPHKPGVELFFKKVKNYYYY